MTATGRGSIFLHLSPSEAQRNKKIYDALPSQAPESLKPKIEGKEK
jgi:hypothetical protein